MVKKWLHVRNTVTIINSSVSKVANQKAGAISLLNAIKRGETASLNDSQKEYTFKIRRALDEILILIIYEVIILFVIVLVVRLVKHIYRLYDFNNLQMPDSYVKQKCCTITMLGNKSDVFSE